MNPLYVYGILTWLTLCIGGAPVYVPDNTPMFSKDERPLPGRHGVHWDPYTSDVSKAYYGDDYLPLHMAHLLRNHASHPENRQPMYLADDDTHEENRKNAMIGIPLSGKKNFDGDGLVRDEKHPAMFMNPHHSTTTTVAILPDKESRKEGSLLSVLGGVMTKYKKATGKDLKGQILANPGWKPIDPHQRTGHEFPLNIRLSAFGTRVTPSEIAENKSQAPSMKDGKTGDKGKAADHTPIASAGENPQASSENDGKIADKGKAADHTPSASKNPQASPKNDGGPADKGKAADHTPSAGEDPQASPKNNGGPADKGKAALAGYIPILDESGMKLRFRVGKEEPEKPKPKPKRPPIRGRSKTLPTYATLLSLGKSPEGHVWRDTPPLRKDGTPAPPHSAASHRNAPFPIDPMTRQPPRPQNRAAYDADILRKTEKFNADFPPLQIHVPPRGRARSSSNPVAIPVQPPQIPSHPQSKPHSLDMEKTPINDDRGRTLSIPLHPEAGANALSSSRIPKVHPPTSSSSILPPRQRTYSDVLRSPATHHMGPKINNPPKVLVVNEPARRAAVNHNAASSSSSHHDVAHGKQDKSLPQDKKGKKKK